MHLGADKAPGHEHPGDGCYGCWWIGSYRSAHAALFTDSRTGRRFCHECTAALVAWEMAAEIDDSLRGDPDLPYEDWLADR